MTGQSIRAVRAHIEILESAGLIGRESRRRADGSLTSDRFKLGIPCPKLIIPNQRQHLPEAESAAGKECGSQRQTLPEPPAGSAAHDPKEIRHKEDPKSRSPSVRSHEERATNNSRNREQRGGRALTERARRSCDRVEVETAREWPSMTPQQLEERRALLRRQCEQIIHAQEFRARGGSP